MENISCKTFVERYEGHIIPVSDTKPHRKGEVSVQPCTIFNRPDLAQISIRGMTAGRELTQPEKLDQRFPFLPPQRACTEDNSSDLVEGANIQTFTAASTRAAVDGHVWSRQVSICCVKSINWGERYPLMGAEV
jgi:hypothetical protein